MADYTSSTSMPAWVQPYAQGYMQQAQNVANMPYQAYQGQTVAGFTPWQQQGYQALAQRAADGSPLMGSAQQALQQMWEGNQRGATQNPYGQVDAGWNSMMVQPGQGGEPVRAGPGGGPIDSGWNYMTVQPGQGGAPVSSGWNDMTVQPGQGGQQVQAGWNSSQVSPERNQYATMDNPYLGQQIDRAQQDVIRNWNNIQMPGFDTAMSRSGSFGNANVKSMAEQGVSDLQKNLGDISSRMRFQDYSQQQQLAENAVNRGMQAQQFNAGLMDTNLARQLQAGQFNAGLGEAAAGRSMQAQQFNAGLNSENLNRQFQAGQFNAGLGEAAAGRGMQAQQFNAGLNSENLMRQMQAGQFNAGLGEAAANRSLQAGQFNAGLGEAAAGRGMQAQQFNAGLMDSNLGRLFQAQQFNAQQGQDWAQRNDSMYQGNQNRMLQSLGLAPQFAQSDYNDINQLINAGGAYQGQNQAQMNDAYRRFLESRAYPQQQLDVMGRALGAFNPGSTTTQQQPGQNPLAAGLGGALTFAQLMQLLGGGG